MPCNIRREAGKSLVLIEGREEAFPCSIRMEGGQSLVILEGKGNVLVSSRPDR